MSFIMGMIYEQKIIDLRQTNSRFEARTSSGRCHLETLMKNRLGFLFQTHA